MRSRIFAALGVALAVVGLAVLAGCTKLQAQPAAPPPTAASVIEVKSGPVTESYANPYKAMGGGWVADAEKLAAKH